MNRFVLVFLILIIGIPGLAQHHFELSDCLLYAQEHSPVLKNAQLDRLEEELENQAEKSDLLPQVDAYLDYQKYFADLPTYIFPSNEGSILSGGTSEGPYPVSLGLPHNLNAGLTVSQVVLDKRFFLGSDLNKNATDLHNLNFEAAQEQLFINIAKVYYQIAANLEKFKIIEYNLERLEKLQPVVSLQVQNDFALQSDLERIVVKKSNLLTNKRRLQAGIALQTNYLKLMMGMAADEHLELLVDTYKADEPAGLFSEPNYNDLLQTRVLMKQSDLNDLNMQLIRAEYLPNLQAYANLRLQAQRSNFNFFDSGQDWYNIHYFGFSLKMPIISGMEKRNQLELATVRQSRLELGLHQNVQKLNIEFQNAKLVLENSYLSLQDLKGNLELAQRLFDQSDLRFREGTGSIVDLLESEATYRESKVNFTTGLLEYKIAELEYHKSRGSLMEFLNFD